MHISLEKCGCGIIKQVFSEQECLSFIEDLELAMSAMPDESIKTGSGAYLGARNLLTWWDGCLGIARHATINTFVIHILGSSAGLVRALYFDKPPGHGWSLPMHREEGRMRLRPSRMHDLPRRLICRAVSKGLSALPSLCSRRPVLLVSVFRRYPSCIYG